MQDTRIEIAGGADAMRHLEDVAALRMTVFRDWPYLYDGDPDYERDYLAAYAASPRSVFVLAFDGARVVGAATGIPLADDAPAFHASFIAQGREIGDVFYFGESVLLPAYRGRGIGHAFFDGREAHARALGGFAWTAFAAVDRDPGDPRRPKGHRGNASFWAGRGYVRQPGLTMRMAWRELGNGECDHALTFWMRPLEAA
ncbi:GNAT family N-acetyltransferase [Luteimonas saliphila]|uniref:GNAT family N-acetyltransferase n=1 Tax=Luteimonas saliphila TaxID=2804919 RepID=UPI00192E0AC3|nr:GNAT family N-acetyltransferase [Luteimonas saliphila]